MTGKITYLRLFVFIIPLQMHSTENSKQVFPEMKLRGLVPNFYTRVSVSDLNISPISPQTQHSKIGEPIVGIYKSLIET